jgi:hypothetical protein
MIVGGLLLGAVYALFSSGAESDDGDQQTGN